MPLLNELGRELDLPPQAMLRLAQAVPDVLQFEPDVLRLTLEASLSPRPPRHATTN